MNIGFYHSIDYGGSPLMGGLQRGLISLGHAVMTASEYGEYDLMLVFNQVSHVTNYVYPPWPRKQCPIALIDASEYGYFKRLPGVVCNYSHGFAEAAMRHDTKNYWEQVKLKRHLEGRSFVYFLREHSIYIDYPSAFVPIDYPLYHLSLCEERPNREEYLSRTKPFWNSWGGSHPWRLPITHALREAGFECLLLEEPTENGPQPRLPQYTDYFPAIESARACCSFDGYGSGSFRRTEVLVRTLLLDGPITIRTYAPLEHGKNVVKYNVWNDGEQFLGTTIVDWLRCMLENPDEAYRIYEAGYHHCMEFYTEEAYARYVLEKIEGHDYTKPTPLQCSPGSTMLTNATCLA